MIRRVNILVVSAYELGHQPYHVASAAAALRSAGHAVRAADLTLEPLDDGDISWADGFAFAVPMHTAMRVALASARQVHGARPDASVCFFGLYAGTADLPGGATALAGEYEPGLVLWAEGSIPGGSYLGRSAVALPPDRSDLAPLDRYVGLDLAGERRIAGSVTASRGCRYRCRHCPVPAVYDGSFRIVDRDIVLQDIDSQVLNGARHISFADPDFFNGPVHSLRILEAIGRQHPELTFDVTIKVEHILRYRHLLPRLAALGVVFVVSAFETTNDAVLGILDKGHTRSDMVEAVHLLRSHAIDIRPTWLPFTPWTTMDDLVDMLEFLETHDLDVDPIQLTIRLLIPRGSLLLEVPGVSERLDAYESSNLTYTWRSADPELDALQRRLAALAERAESQPPDRTLATLVGEILRAAGRPEDAVRVTSGEGRPRLTEPWFC